VQEKNIFPEPDDESPGILKPCYDSFAESYFLHLNNPEHTYVVAPEYSQTEVIRLHSWEQPYDILLYRPDVSSEDTDIAFWVTRLNTGWKDRSAYEYLVAFKNDFSQFYVIDDEDGPPKPFGREASREIEDYIKHAELLPLDT
jgi:hypothetical protein